MQQLTLSVITSNGSCSIPDRAQKTFPGNNEAGWEEMDGDLQGLTKEAWLTACLSPKLNS